MNRNPSTKAYEVDGRSLIYDSSIPATISIVELDSPAGVIEAGTVMAIDSTGKYFIAGTAGKTAMDIVAVAAETVDTTGMTGKVSISAFITGCLNGNCLVKAAGDVTADDVLKLHKNGIVIKYAVEA